jgi:hypothetical protein
LRAAAISFPNRDYTGFVEEVKARVAEYFETRNLSRNATPAMVIKTVLLLALTFIPYGLALSNRFTPLTLLGFAVVMGIGLAGIGFAISHDALHGAYSANPRINALLGQTFDLLSANGYVWKITQRHSPYLHQHRRRRRGSHGVTAAAAFPGAPLLGSIASSTCTGSRPTRCPRFSGYSSRTSSISSRRIWDRTRTKHPWGEW